MVKRTEELLYNQENIRLISVIAHVDHGKTTLTDSLLARAGLIDEKQAGNKRGTDTMEEEKERGITIRSTGVSMQFKGVLKQDDDYVVHLVDSPGHVDFSSEVTAALRVTDGAVVVVDCVEGVCVQTETVLRQAIMERVKPILVLNKIDRAVLDLQLEPEDAYQSFMKTIESVNAVVSACSDPSLGDITFHPAKGNVVFASGLFGWGVSLPQFAKKIAAKSEECVKNPDLLRAQTEKLANKLWGDYFFDQNAKKVVSTSTPQSHHERYVCKVLFGPLFKIIRATMASDWAELNSMISKVGITLSEKERELTGKELMKCVMRKFLPLAQSLLECIAEHLPNPKVAQKYRAEVLYDGDLNDQFGKGIYNCDPEGPLVAYISKLFPVANTKSFYAFGRVFSGTIRSGQKVYVFDTEAARKEESSKNVQGVLCMSIRAMERLDTCPCGNIVALQGIDTLLLKSGTVSSSKEAGLIKSMKFSVSPVVRAAVACKNPADLPKLIDGLRALAKVDPCVQCVIDETSGEHIIGAAGDLHLQVCMNILRNEYCRGMELVESEPMVSFRETVVKRSAAPGLAKSPNKHNRLYAEIEPLNEEICDAIDKKAFSVTDQVKRGDYLIDKQGWDPIEAKKKIWCFGPETEPTNVVVDATKGIAYLNEIKDSFVGGFNWGAMDGPLCGEPVRGVAMRLIDVTLHADTIHRGPGQIIPTSRRLLHGVMMAAGPAMMEPIFLVDIQTTATESVKIYPVITARRGTVFQHTIHPNGTIAYLKAFVPVMESFGLTAALRECTHGQAFPQCIFDHWRVVSGDPLAEGTLPNTIVKTVRARKRMPASIPLANALLDTL